MTRNGWIVVAIAILVAAWTRYGERNLRAELDDAREAKEQRSTTSRARPAPAPASVRLVDRGCDLAELSEAVTGTVRESLRESAEDDGAEQESEPASPESLERARQAVDGAIASGFLDAERAAALRSTLAELDPQSRMDLALEVARAVNAGDLELSGPAASPL